MQPFAELPWTLVSCGVQDVQYADIDHYDENKVFTIDTEPGKFDDLAPYFNQLRQNGMHTIIILVRIHTDVIR